jgi:glycosyltransferase involved in cell wall biosynthesis
MDLSPFISALKKFNDNVKIKWFTIGHILQKETKEKLKITDRLIEFGWVDYFQNSDILSCADIYILLKEPNQTNIAGWPNKLGDYMACGRPIMLNPYGDVRQFVKKYPEGFVQIKRDIKDIEDKIRILYSKKKKILYQMGKKNREIAENNISWNKQSEKLLSFYNKIR